MAAGRLICIVEGVGERTAVPVLVNNMLKHLRRDRLLAASPERTIVTKSGDRITAPYAPERGLGIEFFVTRAANDNPAAILVLVDAEERCLQREQAGMKERLGPHLLARARTTAGDTPVSVVVANRMFESWLLADFHSLRARGHFPAAARFSDWRTPEELAGCKAKLEHLLGRKYGETSDQTELAQHLSLPLRAALRQRSPSLAYLFKQVDELSKEVRKRIRGRV